jgi:hypothetical protein
MSQAERKAVRAMALATDGFEPYPAFVVTAPILQSLIDRGLVERGLSNRPAVAAEGFRLTETGVSELEKSWRHPQMGRCRTGL